MTNEQAERYARGFYKLAAGRLLANEALHGVVKGIEHTDRGMKVLFKSGADENDIDRVSKFLVSVHNNAFNLRKKSGINIGRRPENHAELLLSHGLLPLITREEFEKFKLKIMTLEPFDEYKQWIHGIREKRKERKVYIQFGRGVPEHVIEAVHNKVNQITDLYFGEHRAGIATSWDKKEKRPRIDVWCADVMKRGE